MKNSLIDLSEKQVLVLRLFLCSNLVVKYKNNLKFTYITRKIMLK